MLTCRTEQSYLQLSGTLYYTNTGSMSNANSAKSTDQGRGYHTVATGDALITVKNHEKDQDITLWGANFCPFVQRVWVAFEVLEIPYKVSRVIARCGIRR